MSYEIKLKDKKEIAEGTIEFVFEKPEGYNFKAGQYTYLTLINPAENDEDGDTRVFSILSAPHEENLSFSTRMRNTAFKRMLKNMNIGEKVSMMEPIGWFVLHDWPERPTVFVAGGIGVAPFMGMLRDAILKKVPHNIYLFYSNRRPEDTAYLAELQEMAKNNENIIFVPTMTDITNSKQSWEGETSMINMDLIKKYVPDVSNAIFYTSGPELMVRAMRMMLSEASIPSANIKSEEFGGY